MLLALFLVIHTATAKEKLPVRFLKLNTTVGIVPVFLARENNAVSRAITPRGPFPIFNTQHQTFYVSIKLNALFYTVIYIYYKVILIYVFTYECNLMDSKKLLHVYSLLHYHTAPAATM